MPESTSMSRSVTAETASCGYGAQGVSREERSEDEGSRRRPRERERCGNGKRIEVREGGMNDQSVESDALCELKRRRKGGRPPSYGQLIKPPVANPQRHFHLHSTCTIDRLPVRTHDSLSILNSTQICGDKSCGRHSHIICGSSRGRIPDLYGEVPIPLARARRLKLLSSGLCEALPADDMCDREERP